MAVCTYDNPSTMARGCWRDGTMICSYTATLLCSQHKIPGRYFFFGANIGPWKTGQLVGDAAALPQPMTEGL